MGLLVIINRNIGHVNEVNALIIFRLNRTYLGYMYDCLATTLLVKFQQS